MKRVQGDRKRGSIEGNVFPQIVDPETILKQVQDMAQGDKTKKLFFVGALRGGAFQPHRMSLNSFTPYEKLKKTTKREAFKRL